MKHNTYKRLLAVVMATTMVMGGSMVAFAGEVQTSGSTDGTGTSNGHLNKKVINVTLPVIASGTTPFAYTADPEGLVSQVAGDTKKLKDGTVVTANGDNVYFLNKAAEGGTDSYTSTSDKLKAINKSSHAIKLTVKAEVTEDANNLPLAEADTEIAAATTAKNALLYLGLNVKVGEATDTQSIVAEGTTIEATIDGVESNFEVVQADNEYKYQEKTGVDATTWKNAEIFVNGKCSTAEITADTVAPKVVYTWSWVDPAASREPSIAGGTTQAVLEENKPVVLNVDLGLGSAAATGIESAVWCGNNTDYLGKTMVYDSTAGTLTIDASTCTYMLNNADGSKNAVKIKFAGVDKEVTITFTAKP